MEPGSSVSPALQVDVLALSHGGSPGTSLFLKGLLFNTLQLANIADTGKDTTHCHTHVSVH